MLPDPATLSEVPGIWDPATSGPEPMTSDEPTVPVSMTVPLPSMQEKHGPSIHRRRFGGSAPGRRPRLRRPLAVIGTGALLSAGVVVTLQNQSSGPLSVLIIVGGMLLLLAFFRTDLTEPSPAAKGLTLRLSRQVAALGAPALARELERTGLAELATCYAVVHAELGDDRESRRTREVLQALVVTGAAGLATSEKVDGAAVRRVLGVGSPVLRLLCVGLTRGDPSLADAGTLLSAVAESRTASEQHHGLALAEAWWPRLSGSDRSAIKAAIRAHGYGGPAVPDPDSDGARIADRILTLPAQGSDPLPEKEWAAGTRAARADLRWTP